MKKLAVLLLLLITTGCLGPNLAPPQIGITDTDPLHPVFKYTPETNIGSLRIERVNEDGHDVEDVWNLTCLPDSYGMTNLTEIKYGTVPARMSEGPNKAKELRLNTEYRLDNYYGEWGSNTKFKIVHEGTGYKVEQWH